MAKKNTDSGGATPATRVLTAAGATFTAHSFIADDRSRETSRDKEPLSFGAEAALALGVPTERVFKTLLAEVDGSLWVAVVPVSGSLDLKALASVANGKRAVMADPARAERSSGYVVGGISPLGQRKPLPTVVDASALDHATVFVSGGRRGLDLELAPQDLIQITKATSAAIARTD